MIAEPAIILFFGLLAGYNFADTYLLTSAAIRIFQGRKLHFYVAIYGVYVTIFVYLAYFLCKEIYFVAYYFLTGGEWKHFIFLPKKMLPTQSDLIVAAFLSALSARRLARFLNRQTLRREFLRVRYIRKIEQGLNSGPLLRLMLRSYQDEKPIAFTQDNGHVFIGHVHNIERFQDDEGSFVEILPFASGYRDDKKQLRITTEYDYIYRKLESSGRSSPSEARNLFHLNNKDFLKVIDLDRVIAANVFDTKAYIAFRENMAIDEGN